MEIELFVYGSPALKDFLKDNPHEWGGVEFLESIVEDGMNVIGIGANISVTGVAAAKRIGKRGNLCSSELTPGYFNILKKTISSSGLENVKVYEPAMTDQVARELDKKGG
jgi:hypothetical protein